MIALEELTKRFDPAAAPAVDGVNLRVDKGEFVAILGESGSGKTTTLKMINRLIEPTSGRVRIAGEDAKQRSPVALRRSIGYMFQGVGLFPHLSIAENISVTPRLLGWPKQRIRQRVDELLGLVRLDPAQMRKRLPAQLSGGQQQRVGLARALAAEPSVVLMDEPFSALDPVTRDAMQRECRNIHDMLGVTTVMVTHDVSEALLMADRVVVMRAGRVAQVAKPDELVAHPVDDDVRAFVRTPLERARKLSSLARESAA